MHHYQKSIKRYRLELGASRAPYNRKLIQSLENNLIALIKEYILNMDELDDEYEIENLNRLSSFLATNYVEQNGQLK